jgi:hypothetical protein
MPVTIGDTSVTFNDSTVLDETEQAARAWVCWNPQNNSIQSSFGISSVSGFTVNFSSSLGDANYAFGLWHSDLYGDGVSNADPFQRSPFMSSMSSTSFTLSTAQPTPREQTAVFFR